MLEVEIYLRMTKEHTPSEIKALKLDLEQTFKHNLKLDLKHYSKHNTLRFYA